MKFNAGRTEKLGELVHTVTISGVRGVESQLEVLLMTKNLLAEETSASNRHLQ